MTSASRSKGEDVAHVAGGLTRAQRKAVKCAYFHTPTGRWRCDGVMHPCDRNLRAKGLVNGIYNELTQLGFAVRAHLTDQEGQNQ